jgi:hypothetical protein
VQAFQSRLEKLLTMLFGKNPELGGLDILLDHEPGSLG